MAGHISLDAYYASSGTLFALALLAALTRIIIRFHYSRKFEVDDGFLFFALATLISGTGLLYANIPLAFVQERVEAGLQAPPPDLIDKLIADEKTQDAGTVLVATAIVSVKYTFMFFFRKLRARTQKRYTTWIWWITFAIVTLCAPVFMFSDFIACSYSGYEILTKCVSQSALYREITVLKVSVITDIISDAFIISIPITILWDLRLSLQKKLSLAAIMCLSVMMIICAIVRISDAVNETGQVNTLWAILWLQLEACVAVITVSVSAFRALFIESKGRSARTGTGTGGYSQRAWPWSMLRSKSDNLETHQTDRSGGLLHGNGAAESLPKLPSLTAHSFSTSRGGSL